MKRALKFKSIHYALAVTMIAFVTAVLAPFHADINATTVALAYLLIVLFVATLWGSGPALLASVLGMLCFNFFFLPPVGTFTIADPQNWVALFAFFITAITVGQLSARARRRAQEAETGRREIKRLYEELRDAFERASQAEAFKRSERFKSALLDAVTHDLRTPLTSIKASATLLLEDHETTEGEMPLPPQEKDALLKVITQEADRLDRFVENIVDLARIEAGKMSLQRNWGPVDEIIEAALTRASRLMIKHEVIVEIEEELPVVRVDSRAVAEVIYTLVDNATKYSKAGTRILIEARRAPDEMIEISVEDEGRGIPRELHERVFEKFFSSDGTSEMNRPRGIGMGLAIARGIIEAHGGRIRVEDARGGRRGTRVSFTVPVGDEEQARGG